MSINEFQEDMENFDLRLPKENILPILLGLIAIFIFYIL